MYHNIKMEINFPYLCRFLFPQLCYIPNHFKHVLNLRVEFLYGLNNSQNEVSKKTGEAPSSRTGLPYNTSNFTYLPIKNTVIEDSLTHWLSELKTYICYA